MMKPFRKRLKYAFLVGLVKFLLWVSSWLPLSILQGLFVGMSRIAYRMLNKEKAIAASNLKIAFPDKTEEEISGMVREMFLNLAKSYAAMIKGIFIKSQQEFLKKYRVRGAENLEEAFQKGKGVIVILPHLGAYELVGIYCGLSYPSIAVGARMKNAQLDELLVRYRTATGAAYHRRDENPLKLVKALKKGYVVGMLVDQDTNKVKNIFVDFFGKKAATPVGAAIFQRKLETAVIPMAVTMEDGKQVLNIGEELQMVKTENEDSDLLVNTKTMMESSESYIKRFPTQWVWFHERWKTRPEDTLV